MQSKTGSPADHPNLRRRSSAGPTTSRHSSSGRWPSLATIDLHSQRIGRLAVVGCGSREFYPVSGKAVGPDGAALIELAGTLIVFESADGRVSSQGSIEVDGGFRMGTLASADVMRPGACRVLIAPPGSVDGDEDLGEATVATTRIVAPRYHSFATSGWEVTVEPKPNAFTFTAERATADPKQ